MSVDIYDGTIPLASVVGNFRQDLLNAGKGNGYYGFSFSVPTSIKDSSAHYLPICFAGTTTLLTIGANLSVNCSPGGGYQYYYADALTSIDPNKWTQNGTVSAGTGGLTSASTNGGSLISKMSVPGGTPDYEVNASLNQQPGGTYARICAAAATRCPDQAATVPITWRSCRIQRSWVQHARPRWQSTKA